ncbi:hypothetical protein AAFC00_002487 [Neodothiora populina]|uniref:SET domain-containing protein n=1 Tax=Neodothiora populina TaxID=2781224 RepID=A0ABR3P788_9PEZI
MTEPPFSLGTFAARQQASLPGLLAPPVRYAPRLTEPPGLDGTVEEEDDGEIICICAYNWDDGYTIQCETCNKWNHMECYYPNESDRPGPDQTHYCVDCQPREVDARRASALQREKYNEQQRENGNKRPVSKAGRKKVKDSSLNGPTVNGWSADKHAHLHGRERKSASPRDLPPPAKKTKTTHRSSTALTNGGPGRKRNGSTLTHQRSPSKSPAVDARYGPVMPLCSQELLHLDESLAAHVNTDTNIWNSIELTNSLSEWLQDPEAVERDCQQKQIDVFKRWDGPFENMPGKPEVSMQRKIDTKFSGTGQPVIYPCITGEEEITQHTFIGELLGHVGFKSEYMDNPEGRWESLRHCEPFVFFHPKLPIFIDARHEGSLYRYVRRSCRPNVEMQTIITEGTTYHFCFMATKDIMPGEEITIGWEFDDRIRAMYAQRTHMSDQAWAPDVREKIAAWVSNVLANCGPCACSGQGCPMAFFDRRGQAIPIPPEPAPIKAPKRKRKTPHISPEDSGRASNHASRSGSESGARKAEQHDDDLTDSRSVSGSYQGSASRDITPGTLTAAVMPELSERERKKLMREEEMFKKQEEEKGKQRKKRNSGGSNLNTPSAATSRQLGQPTTSKYADAATSSRNSTHVSRQSGGRRGAKQGQSSSRGVSKSSSKPLPKPVYVDSAIQCDMDLDEAAARPLVTPPKRKQYISVTQRLLRRCASNNFKRKADPEEDEPKRKPPPPPKHDMMDVDRDEGPNHKADTAGVLPLSPISDKVKDVDADVPLRGDVSKSKVVMSPAFGDDDTVMQDADPDEDIKDVGPSTQKPSSVIKEDHSSPSDKQSNPASNPPMDPPPPPWPVSSPIESPKAIEKTSEISGPHQHGHIVTAPVAPMLSSVSSTDSSQPGGSAAKSPSVTTQGLTPTSIFPPAVSASLNPSPIARKKMSLSDYTKRSKAQRPESSAGASHRESSPATSVVSTEMAPRDNILHGSAISESPAPESIPPSSAEGRKMESAVDAREERLDEGSTSHMSATFGDNGLPTVTMSLPEATVQATTTSSTIPSTTGAPV